MPRPAERPYSYAVPEGMQVGRNAGRGGVMVRVPLGRRPLVGIIRNGAADQITRRRGGPSPRLSRWMARSSPAAA
ncbi:hypothetical protein VSX64_20285 [Aurantimonas sp. C2-6-R+9]|uniref:primosomal protein N' family DNA-binding protein n=1 Tax=unclassified Aurantimonas TaxID=2638230 RepID=UPI002E187E7D|nr:MULTISPECIES: hypothetical protein [unclassified Aurantimonas]MEC5293007.1 hypothetical protein [Aurantimonas sp. C2-3-R2]MEC5383167.1 hypothetical protein [Aurantimonas sp. C2-6-R+9]MEC5414060.1 hypothetical protein [Aurantimonas sp. C2-4-R8]